MCAVLRCVSSAQEYNNWIRWLTNLGVKWTTRRQCISSRLMCVCVCVCASCAGAPSRSHAMSLIISRLGRQSIRQRILIVRQYRIMHTCVVYWAGPSLWCLCIDARQVSSPHNRVKHVFFFLSSATWCLFPACHPSRMVLSKAYILCTREQAQQPSAMWKQQQLE